LIEAPLESASLPEAEFDLVIMNQLIEHLWNPVAAMTKISSALRNNGHVSIETVNLNGYDRKLFKDGYWGGYYFPRHLNLFTPESLDRLLSKSGLDVVNSYSLVAPIVWAFSMHAVLSARPDSLFARLAMRFFTDKNPFCLALFTFLDLTAIICGVATSNQKMIAKKNASQVK
jgi:SAM-dependent methyltransferase